MRYAIFTDIHANLEALEAVLKKIDEISKTDTIDQIWFLGDLVGYGPNPNECIAKLRERTDVIIAGNHDWAAVGKIDLEDFSEAARLSAEWTAARLTDENKQFLANLPERLHINDCTLVHGSPYGPLWEYLTTEVLAERSFQQFTTRYCFVGHTHVPVIFQQPDTVSNAPTHPLELAEIPADEGEANKTHAEPATQTTLSSSDNTETAGEESTLEETQQLQDLVVDAADAFAELQQQLADDKPELDIPVLQKNEQGASTEDASAEVSEMQGPTIVQETPTELPAGSMDITPEETIQDAEQQLNQEIEELLSLLGLSQSMIEVTNQMLTPPEGHWDAPEGYRAIINPGGVGQPRDGDPRAAFMIFDTEKGFTFYRVAYPYEKTQKKILKTALPQYLATRLAYGR
jgi:diadenosine tetraphosphatase ApaH/serine/threonine PP2A family protein phosphatase